MRLSHSISMTLLFSALASLTGCGEESEPGSDSNGGTGMGGAAGSGVGGSATGGSAGSAVGGSATGGSAGSAVGGSGGSAMGGSAGGGALDHPTDQTQAGIEAYLMMESYKAAGWRPEAMPGDDMAMPHLATNRFFNETIIASKAAGNRPPSMGQHTPGSMSVKEILDGTTVVGKAATLRTDAGMWIYYCKASVADRCGTNSMPDVAVYTTSPTQSCACHGSGTNTSHEAIPAP